MTANLRILSTSATPAHEFTTLLSPAIVGWLAARGCEALAMQPAGAARARGDEAPLAEILADGRAIEFTLTARDAGIASPLRLRLLVRDAAAFSAADLQALSVYLSALLRFPFDTPISNEASAVLLQGEVLRRFVHDLRNHFNTLLMSASVVADQCKDKQRYGRYIEQIESEGDKCARALAQLSDLYL